MKIFWHEIHDLFLRKWFIAILFIAPIILTFYCGYLLDYGLVRHIPTVIVDNDNSQKSREIIKDFNDNEYFNVYGTLDNLRDAEKLMENETVNFIVSIPQNFSKHINNNNGTEILFSANGSNMAISSTALRQANEIIQYFNKKYATKYLARLGTSNDRSYKVVSPLNIYFKNIANPIGNYGDYLLVGFIGAIVQFPLIAIAFGRHSNLHITKYSQLFSRLFIMSIIGTMAYGICYWIAIHFFHLSYIADFLPVFVLLMVFCLTIASFGMFISLLIRNPQYSTHVGMMLVGLPALLLSGYTWPMYRFNIVVKICGLIEPLTHMINPLRRLFLMNLVTKEYWNSLTYMLILSTTLTIGSCFYLKLKNKEEVEV